MPNEQHLTLTYYGHCSFMWQTARGVKVIADPYRNQKDFYWFTRKFPKVDCDLALVTHAHFDHDAVNRLPEAASVLRMPGYFQLEDMSIRGVLDWHSGQWTSEQLLDEAPRMTPKQILDRHFALANIPNVMFLLEANGIRFLHIGDNRADWPAEVRQAIGQVDVLMVTVDDSCHLLSYQQVNRLIGQLRPRVVVPMHYQIPGLNPPTVTLDPPDRWLSTQPDVRRIESHKVTIGPGDLPHETQVWLFEPSPASLAAPTVEPEEI